MVHFYPWFLKIYSAESLQNGLQEKLIFLKNLAKSLKNWVKIIENWTKSQICQNSSIFPEDFSAGNFLISSGIKKSLKIFLQNSAEISQKFQKFQKSQICQTSPIFTLKKSMQGIDENLQAIEKSLKKFLQSSAEIKGENSEFWKFFRFRNLTNLESWKSKIWSN